MPDACTANEWYHIMQLVAEVLSHLHKTWFTGRLALAAAPIISLQICGVGIFPQAGQIDFCPNFVLTMGAGWTSTISVNCKHKIPMLDLKMQLRHQFFCGTCRWNRGYCRFRWRECLLPSADWPAGDVNTQTGSNKLQALQVILPSTNCSCSTLVLPVLPRGHSQISQTLQTPEDTHAQWRHYRWQH